MILFCRSIGRILYHYIKNIKNIGYLVFTHRTLIMLDTGYPVSEPDLNCRYRYLKTCNLETNCKEVNVPDTVFLNFK
jgi:hypothetical protein